MAVVIKLPKSVLIVGTDTELIVQSRILNTDSTQVLKLANIETALRYLMKHNDANEVWVYPSALDGRNPRFLEAAIKLRHPGVRVRFVATSFKEMMSTPPETDWWILEPDKQTWPNLPIPRTLRAGYFLLKTTPPISHSTCTYEYVWYSKGSAASHCQY